MTIYSLGAKEKMPKPYSYDLRQKVIQAIELDGMSQNQAAMAFHISRSTINLWCQRKAREHNTFAMSIYTYDNLSCGF